jgi:hypothetical protein
MKKTSLRGSTSIPYEMKVQLDSLESYKDTPEYMTDVARLTEHTNKSGQSGIRRTGTRMGMVKIRTMR